ncbi:hypothetical protein BpHYR1_040281 [Brachionus plicatilis]|uniref:Uncharacterized protein n=1 Tax=Brachionus plicatilis TaxID=10195 RepID=A0A3M7R921_BRAPC|nr:hypothetical protein BpHYR1_040281 [Brachionus plicatilis]
MFKGQNLDIFIFVSFMHSILYLNFAPKSRESIDSNKSKVVELFKTSKGCSQKSPEFQVYDYIKNTLNNFFPDFCKIPVLYDKKETILTICIRSALVLPLPKLIIFENITSLNEFTLLNDTIDQLLVVLLPVDKIYPFSGSFHFKIFPKII